MNCYLSINIGITIIIYYLAHAAFESFIYDLKYIIMYYQSQNIFLCICLRVTIKILEQMEQAGTNYSLL